MEDIMATNSIVVLEGESFESEVLQSSLPVVVDFWAEWCGPCKMIAPVLEEVAAEYEGRVKVGKLNVDENRQTALQFGIRSIPTILFFKEGQKVDQLIGAVPKKALKEKFEALL
jgi:thioredoxin 1